jgi:hypothetical protein
MSTPLALRRQLAICSLTSWRLTRSSGVAPVRASLTSSGRGNRRQPASQLASCSSSASQVKKLRPPTRSTVLAGCSRMMWEISWAMSLLVRHASLSGLYTTTVRPLGSRKVAPEKALFCRFCRFCSRVRARSSSASEAANWRYPLLEDDDEVLPTAPSGIPATNSRSMRLRYAAVKPPTGRSARTHDRMATALAFCASTSRRTR